MIKLLTVSIGALACLSGCMKGPPQEKAGNIEATSEKQFKVFCDVFTGFTETPEFAQLNSEQRSKKFVALLQAKPGQASDAYAAWGAIQSAPPQERYRLLQGSASSVGEQDWTCASAEQYMNEVGANFD